MRVTTSSTIHNSISQGLTTRYGYSELYSVNIIIDCNYCEDTSSFKEMIGLECLAPVPGEFLAKISLRPCEPKSQTVS